MNILVNMELDDKQKAEQSQEAIEDFAKLFGPNDLCKEALFDVLLELIYNYDEYERDDIHLPSSQRQEDNQVADDGRNGQMPTYEIE